LTKQILLKAIISLFLLLSLLLIIDLFLPLKTSTEKVLSTDETFGGTRRTTYRYFWIETEHQKFNIKNAEVWENSKAGDSFRISYTPIFKVAHVAQKVFPDKSEVGDINYDEFYVIYFVPFVLFGTCLYFLFRVEDPYLIHGVGLSVMLCAILVVYGMPGILRFF
jgi:hypothetical protein